MSKMKNIFEAKSKKKNEKGAPGKETKVDAVPTFWSAFAKPALSGMKQAEPVEEAVDIALLRDPAKFLKGVEKFVTDTKGDVDKIQHFASTYKGSSKVPPEQQKQFQSVEFSLKMINKFVAELERAAGTASGGSSAPAATTGSQPKKQGMLGRLFGKGG